MFTLSQSPIYPEALKQKLENPSAGAFVCFEGWVRNRNEGKSVTMLEYEAYDALCHKEAETIFQEAKAQFPILDMACVHRTGVLQIGDLAVWVGVTAAHRKEAFQACRYIIDQIKIRLPIWKKEHYTDGTSGWVNCQQCSNHPSAALEERHLYSRQILLPQMGEEGQEKLKQSKVLVVGAGGLGTSALQYLAAAGVGTLGICEFDHLDASNLHRQVLYTTEEVGQPKIHLAAQRLKAMNPFIKINLHPDRLDTENIENLLSSYDLILDCCDNFESKFLLNDAAVLFQKNLIQASIYQYEGQLHLYTPDAEGGCLRCLWAEIPESGCVGTCSEVGVFGAVPGMFGTLQALEAIKWIVGLPTPLATHTLLMDLLTYETHRIRRPRSKHCPLCGETPTILDLTPSVIEPYQLTERDLRETCLDYYEVIDIREPSEDPLELGVKHTRLPLSQLDWDYLPFTPPQKYLLVCQKGKRSLALVRHLVEKGYPNIFSLQGGVSTLQRLSLMKV